MNETRMTSKPSKVVIPDEIERIATVAVNAAFAVHTELGPGLLEAAYESCFAYELELRGIKYQRQLPVPLNYKGKLIEVGFRADMILEGKLLIERDGLLVACAHIEKQGHAAYFGMFSVRPDLQGGGLGKLMLAEAERIAREEWACRELQMTVISIRDALIEWYERRGYRRTSRYSPFPYGDERFGIPKRDDLRFEYLVKTL